MSEKVNKIVTDRIIELMEQGTVPWARPWKSAAGRPRNAISKKPYRGINALITSPVVSRYGDNNWYTSKQLNNLGLRLKPEQKYTPVLFFNWVEREGSNGKTKIPFTRFYKCFNREQIQDSDTIWPREDDKPIEGWESKAEKLIEEYGIKVEHGASGAFYQPVADKILMPHRADFNCTDEYWSAYFHEAIHSTGHASRLNRKEGMKAIFGDHNYSKEELIAEMGSCFLMSDFGQEKHMENSAAYLKSWLKVFKQDRKILIQAAQQAQKGYDLIKGEQYNAS